MDKIQELADQGIIKAGSAVANSDKRLTGFGKGEPDQVTAQLRGQEAWADLVYRNRDGDPVAYMTVDPKGGLSDIYVKPGLGSLAHDRAVKALFDNALESDLIRDVVGLTPDQAQLVQRYTSNAIRQFADGATKRLYRIADSVVKKYGDPAKQMVRVVDSTHEFQLNDQTAVAAASYQYASSRVTIYKHQISHLTDLQIKGVINHEMSHRMYYSTVKNMESTWKQTGQLTPFGKAMMSEFMPGGSISNIASAVKKGANSLPKFSGVTPYSRKWWERAKKNPTSSNMVDAINETLAETAYMRTNYGPDWFNKPDAMADYSGHSMTKDLPSIGATGRFWDGMYRLMHMDFEKINKGKTSGKK